MKNSASFIKSVLISALLPAVVLLMPVSGHADQWKPFEHRYEYKLSDVLAADKFVQKQKFWEGFKGDKLVGYVFLSKDWTAKLVGYSGKHLETLIGMDTEGKLTGVKLLFHSEPIVLIGLKEESYLNFLKQYPGKDIKAGFSVGKEVSMDAITGATVTAMVHNSIILGSARNVAAQTGVLTYAKHEDKILGAKYASATWKELIDGGAVKNVVIKNEELNSKDEGNFFDLSFGLIPPPSIGKNVLGDGFYSETMETIKDGGSAIFIINRGSGSFKGSGFVRGGLFDRFSVEQEDRVYVFKDKDYRILTDVKAEGAPKAREGGVFIIRGKDFDPTQPFKLKLTITYREGVNRKFKATVVDYKVPDKYIE
jgi:NosR/NirI family nitrous oxide reductase transcriptional regulator